MQKVQFITGISTSYISEYNAMENNQLDVPSIQHHPAVKCYDCYRKNFLSQQMRWLQL